MLGMTAVIVGRGVSETCACDVANRRSPAHTFPTTCEMFFVYHLGRLEPPLIVCVVTGVLSRCRKPG